MSVSLQPIGRRFAVVNNALVDLPSPGAIAWDDVYAWRVCVVYGRAADFPGWQARHPEEPRYTLWGWP